MRAETLRAGDPLGALSEVESYRREVSDGAFAAEAALFGIAVGGARHGGC